jgi:hypothetical protein
LTYRQYYKTDSTDVWSLKFMGTVPIVLFVNSAAMFVLMWCAMSLACWGLLFETAEDVSDSYPA